MKKSMRTHTLFALGLAALVGCSSPDDAPIRIGVAGPVSQDAGRSMERAVQLAVDEINRAGGIAGRPLEIIVRDDNAIPEQAIAVARELRDDTDVVAVVGHVNSAASIAAAEIYNDEARGVAAVSPASSSPGLSEAGPWSFRVCPTDLQHGPALADWIRNHLNRDRTAVLYANDDYGRGVLESFGRAFEQAGGTIISRDPFLPALVDSDEAVDPYIERAIRSGMDALVIAGQAETALTILRAARRLGYTGPVLGADGITGLREAGEIAEGVYITSAFLPDRPTAAAQRFVNNFLARFDDLPDHRAAMAYDVVYLLARAIEEVGPDRRAIRDYLATVGNTTPPFEGVSGTIGFDENGDVAGIDVTVGIVQNGQLRTAS